MVYISVESRKGGVGKTTTAITMAESLLSEDYQVLMIDMDIVGTTIDPSFINANVSLIHEVKLKGKAVNLVRLFKEVYVAGKNVPSFAPEEEHNDTSFSFAIGKCNFVGSNIYDEQNGNTPLEDPRILYDAFHAYWLLEFVKQISNSFTTAIGKDAKVAVILDNSPGFSSIENSIHDYLTDIGPEFGKVLLVSTIDPQDINACRQSKAIIKERFKDKVAAGEYYRALIAGEFRQKKDTPAFESVWNSLCASGGQLPAYHAVAHKEETTFVSILVNKVPSHIYDQLYTKRYLQKDTEEATPFQNHLLYYFSNPLLMANQIAHQQGYGERYVQYVQSCKISEIEADDLRYMDLCKASRQIGFGDFFKEEWAPMAYFRDILNIMKSMGILNESSEMGLIVDKGRPVELKSGLSHELNAVRRFVMNNLKHDSIFVDQLEDVVSFVSSVLINMHEKTELDFHPEHPKLQEIGNFVASFGLAVYRLHIYEQVCEMLNKLMMYCFENAENIELVNKDALSNWIGNVLEGRVIEQDYVAVLLKMLDDRQNARELSKTMQIILRSWGL